jgi:predicted Zn-dependent protease
MRIDRVAILILAGLPLTAQEPLGPANNGANFYSIEKEGALGSQMAASVRQRTTRIDSPTLQNYLDRLGRRIAAELQGTKFPFTFSVIAEDACPTIHEPVALPGGYVFVPVALFSTAQDEGEFAGMLARAMEHIAERHGARQATRGQVVNYASIPLIFMGGSGSCSEGLAIPRGFLALQRSNELEADSLAVQTMAHAGFDPMALLRYIERVQFQPGSATQKVFSALPDRDRRVASIRSIIEKLPPANYTAPVEEFAAVQRELNGLVERRAPPTLKRRGSK